MLYLQARRNKQPTLDIGTESRNSIELNLRESCLACKFMSSCVVMDEIGAADRDDLVGLYRFSALKDRCIV